MAVDKFLDVPKQALPTLEHEQLLGGIGQATLLGIAPAETVEPARAAAVNANLPLDSLGRYIGPEEKALAKTFYDSVWKIDLSEVLRLPADRTKPPRNLDEYRLVPLRNKNYRHSSLTSGSWVEQPHGIAFSYQGKKDKAPYLDTSFAIGLSFRNCLSAVAAGHLTPEGRLRIVQLQGVAPPVAGSQVPDRSGRKVPPEAQLASKYHSGLHGGFLWRDTLVASWIKIADGLAIPTTEIQGWKNNEWKDCGDTGSTPRNLALMAGHDGVAERMGFTYDPVSFNWWINTAEFARTPSDIA